MARKYFKSYNICTRNVNCEKNYCIKKYKTT